MNDYEILGLQLLGANIADLRPGTRVSGKSRFSQRTKTGNVERARDAGPDSTSVFVRWDDGSGESLEATELTVLTSSPTGRAPSTPAPRAPRNAVDTTINILRSLPGWRGLTPGERSVIEKFVASGAAELQPEQAGAFRALPTSEQTAQLKLLAYVAGGGAVDLEAKVDFANSTAPSAPKQTWLTRPAIGRVPGWGVLVGGGLIATALALLLWSRR